MSNVVSFPGGADARTDAFLAAINTLARMKVQFGGDAAQAAAVGMVAGAITSMRVTRGSDAALRLLNQMRAGIVAQDKADHGVRGRR